MAILQLHTIPKGLYFSYSEVFVLLFALSTHQRVFISTMYPLKSINRFQHQRISQHLTLFFKYGHLLSPPHTRTHTKKPQTETICKSDSSPSYLSWQSCSGLLLCFNVNTPSTCTHLPCSLSSQGNYLPACLSVLFTASLLEENTRAKPARLS